MTWDARDTSENALFRTCDPPLGPLSVERGARCRNGFSGWFLRAKSEICDALIALAAVIRDPMCIQQPGVADLAESG